MDIQKIIKRCQSGEKDAFEELLRPIEKKALSTAYLLCGNKDMAEDILQETYLNCFLEIKQLKNSECFKTWFYKILVCTGYKIRKKQSHVIPMEITNNNENLFYNMNNNKKNCIDEIDTKYFFKSIVDGLSEKLKMVVIFYYYNDMTVEEIAKITGMLKATVKSRLFYARRELKKQIEIIHKDEECLSASTDKGACVR